MGLVRRFPPLYFGDPVIVLRGKHKGVKFRVHQAENDWVMVDHPQTGDKAIILSRRNVELLPKRIYKKL